MAISAPARPQPRRRVLWQWPQELSEGRLALLINLPVIILLLLLIAYPLAYAFRLSVSQVTLAGLRANDIPFVGLKNFAAVLSDQLFLVTLARTLAFGAVSVFLMLVVGLFVALAMNMDSVFLSRVTRGLVLLPWAVPAIANGVMWSFIFNPRYGHLNALLLQLGLIDAPLSYLSHPVLAMACVIIAYVWRVFPFSALLFHAALQAIPKEVYEAAEVDGATGWSQFWRITLPLLRPVVAVLLVLRTAFALMIFDEVFALTRGGPGTSTWTAAWYSYFTTFDRLKFDQGAASAFILALVIFVLALLYIRFIYRVQEQ